MEDDLVRFIRYCAGAACATALAMFGVYAITGIGQDSLQAVHAPGDYAALLTRNPAVLRTVIGLDNVFIVFYTGMFVLLGVLLPRLGRPRVLVLIAVGLLIALALLDYAENLHFLVMLADAEASRLPTHAAIAGQVLESLMKFHVGYLGLFLLGLAIPRRTAQERTLANLLLFIQPPIGILIYVTPSAIAIPLVIARFAWFVGGFILIGWAFGRPSALTVPDAHGGGAGSSAPA